MKKNILVVEDNELNLEVIRLLVSQYAQEQDEPIEIFSASDGQMAVELCKMQQIDIIFMDLMMPIMGGIEATKQIKAAHPKTMIIAVSAYGDEEKQKQMLRNGAEDYMTKPLNALLFKNRLRNYLKLLKTRNHIGNKAKARNLFTSKAYNYHIDFTVATDADLSEFWEAILMRFDFQRHIEHISDFVRFVYRLGMLQLQNRYKFHIVIEEDTEHFYFTLDNIKMLGCVKISALLAKHYEQAEYLCKENILSFSLAKMPPEELEVLLPDAPAIAAPAQNANAIIMQTPKDEEKRTFAILEPDELQEFEDYLLKLRSLILMMENSSLEASDIEELCSCFNEMGSILSISNDSYVLSNALKQLSSAIAHNHENFSESSSQLFDFVNAFVNDLIFWKNKIFYEGAPSVDFLNDSITSNANMLHSLLQPSTKGDEELDDIFDF
ncbi:MAG: response regulator [Campylobacterales bacterium]|nr:response regulator [Campylobacterales bacterium]